jgi:hypothetical protein
VEAPGVEPGSENVGGKEPTYLAASCSQPSLGAFAARAQKRQETRTASLWISPRKPRHSVQGQSAV